MSEIILDSVIDSIKLLPFLFLTYLFMEWLEHKTGAAARKRIRTAGKFGPVWGGLLGVIPQCGFSAAASSLFAGRVITVGTLIAVYLSTSDEMFPIMISNAVPVVTIVKILTCKAVIGILSGLVLEYVYTHILKKQEPDVDIHEICEEERCHCEHGVISSAAFHTLKVFVYIFLISLVLNIIIGLVGEETLAGLFTGTPIAGELIAALVGLIPNCASSVVITQLYLDHIIGAGAMMAGLLVNAGVGLLILFRLNRDRVQNLKIVGVLYGLGVFWGIIIEFAGIVFLLTESALSEEADFRRNDKIMAGSSYATASRRKILEYLKNSNDHTVTAADVDEYLKKHDSEVNITTIYRYLDKLAKDGTVIKYVAEKGCQAAYQYVEPGRGCEQHLHLKCVKCGKIIHLECHFMEEISHHIEESHGFTLQCKNSILYGVCKECKGSGEDC